MKWDRGYQSSDVDDNRGRSALGGGVGLLGPAVAIGARFGLPGIALAIAAVFFLPRLLGGGGPQALSDQGSAQERPADEQKEFVSFVFDDVQRTWSQVFAANNRQYRKTRLELFSDQTASGCGMSSAAVGPFYCPADGLVYIDLRFYQELARRFGAPGDFAQAYVIAHEVGHHVQNLLGISGDVHRQQQRVSKAEANDLSVRLELQADFFAGVWAHHANAQYQILEPGDVKEALEAAEAIGDDRLQMQSRGYVVPDSFTHGTSEQRATWFYKGLKTGDMNQGDTFSVRDL